MQVVERVREFGAVVGVEVEVVLRAPDRPSLSLSERIVRGGRARLVDALAIVVVVAGHQLVDPDAAVRQRSVDLRRVRHRAAGKHRQHAVRGQPLHQGAARVHVVDVLDADRVRGVEVQVVEVEGQRAAHAEKDHS